MCWSRMLQQSGLGGCWQGCWKAVQKLFGVSREGPVAQATSAVAAPTEREDPLDPTDFLLGHRHTADFGYDKVWLSKVLCDELLTTDTTPAHCDGWTLIPKLRRYRELSKEQRYEVGLATGKRLVLHLKQYGPAVFCVEKPFLDGVLAAFSQNSVDFVLLAINGGDAPMTEQMQRRIAATPGLKRCFGNNLCTSNLPELFSPMPIGVDGQASVRKAWQESRAWGERDARLLVPPMRLNNRWRKIYLDILSRPEFSGLVYIVTEKISKSDFHALLARHRCVLSPPGRGYDCGRTWQSLAVGSVPMVVEDADFDQRLHHEWNIPFIPPPDALTPESLSQVLKGLSDPKPLLEKLTFAEWSRRWNEALTS